MLLRGQPSEYLVPAGRNGRGRDRRCYPAKGSGRMLLQAKFQFCALEGKCLVVVRHATQPLEMLPGDGGR